jgi:UDP:flavonoid glycosyltransferase YjiC (YdhE family)
MIPKDRSPADIAGAIDQVLHDPSFHATAERIANQSAPLGRGARAAGLIAQLAANGRTS